MGTHTNTHGRLQDPVAFLLKKMKFAGDAEGVGGWVGAGLAQSSRAAQGHFSFFASSVVPSLASTAGTSLGLEFSS